MEETICLFHCGAVLWLGTPEYLPNSCLPTTKIRKKMFFINAMSKNNKKACRKTPDDARRLRLDTKISATESNDAKKTNVLNHIKNHWWAVGLIVFLALGVVGAGLKYLEDSAQKEKSRQQQNPLAKNDSLLAKINPFIPAPLPATTPQLSKEYIYTGSRLLAVEDAGASAVPPTDLAVWRPSSGYWWVMGGTNSQQFAAGWGMQGDKPAPGDYDGDGKTDLAIFRESTGLWWIVKSSDNTFYTVSLGTSGDATVQADYDGDGKTDPAVYHISSSNRIWRIIQSTTQDLVSAQFGLSDDKAIPGDYDGDGKADIAVWRGSSSTYYILKTSNGQYQIDIFGQLGDIPVPADYDGDNKVDYALRRGANWIFKRTTDGQIVTIKWQQASDLAVQNDYDGDGLCDIAVWRSSNGNWYIRQSSHVGQSNELRQVAWGTSGDIPVPSLYRR